MQSVRAVTNRAGQTVSVTNRYTVLGNGMNKKDASGNFVECKPVVHSFPAGIVCTGATYQVVLKQNLNRQGSVDVETGDGKRFVSHPLAIAYFDPATGRREWIANIKDCQAEVVSNKVIYASAFAGRGIEATVVYTYGRGRFQQDVIFTKKPSVTPADLGMGSRARVEVITEIMQSPTPTKQTRILRAEKNPLLRSQMVEPDLVDESLVFSEQMRMPLGYAFPNNLTGTNQQRRIPVAKRLRTMASGRTVLTEVVEWDDVRAELDKLPKHTASIATPADGKDFAQTMPAQPVAERDSGTFERQLAQVLKSGPPQVASLTRKEPDGFVVDYQILGGTYYIYGGTYLVEEDYWTEGWLYSGVIIKFQPGASLTMGYCDPQGNDLILTSANDDSVGEVIDGSTGLPAQQDSYFQLDGALAASFGDVDCRYMAVGMDVTYGNQGVYGGTWKFRHCGTGLKLTADNVTAYAQSFLVCDVQTPVDPGSNNFSPTVGEADCDGDYDNNGLDDGFEIRNFGYVGQDPNGDPDTDGLTNLQEYQLGTNPNNADTDDDGMPDGWEWRHFGNFAQIDSGDYDSDGLDNAAELVAGTDPNDIYFSIEVASQYVTTSSINLQLAIRGGVPNYYTLLVESTNFAGANWTNYTSSNITANFGTNQGWHDLWVGVKGHASDSSKTWVWKRLKLDTTPPLLTVTNPTNSTVMQPVLQVFGFCPEALDYVSYDLSNAVATVTNQQVLVLDQYFDASIGKFTTNTFQAFDVPLTNGINSFTFHAKDLAGNMATLTTNFTLSYSNKPSPVIQLGWPENGMKVCGDSFTCSGLVSDPTAGVAALIVHTNGTTNVFKALVGRDGKFYADNIPLHSGTNIFTVTATDVIGNVATTNLAVIQGDAGLIVDPIASNQTTVTGKINSDTYTVWVNGVKATTSSTTNGEGVYTWQADDVPIPPNGSLVQVTAIPNSDNGGYGSWGGGQ